MENILKSKYKPQIKNVHDPHALYRQLVVEGQIKPVKYTNLILGRFRYCTKYLHLSFVGYASDRSTDSGFVLA